LKKDRRFVMDEFRGNPSKWLLNNSSGYPDFLFTILTYSMVLLALVLFIWIAVGILVYKNAQSENIKMMMAIMENLKTGLLSLCGVVFGLAGSYTVRRFKKDEQYMQLTKRDTDVSQPIITSENEVIPVLNEEDI
jgi:H+/Cl- antiporter ClcA